MKRVDSSRVSGRTELFLDHAVQWLFLFPVSVVVVMKLYLFWRDLFVCCLFSRSRFLISPPPSPGSRMMVLFTLNTDAKQRHTHTSARISCDGKGAGWRRANGGFALIYASFIFLFRFILARERFRHTLGALATVRFRVFVLFFLAFLFPCHLLHIFVYLCNNLK